MMEHVKYLDQVFGQLKWVGLKIKVEKCKFAKLEIKLLGYQILAEGTIPDPGKVTAIEALERSTTISKLREFLEAVGFFRKDLVKSGCLRMGASINHFLSSFHASSISNI